MEGYERLGHMTEISAIASYHYFIPHHCVIKPESTATKLRAAFDASAKTSAVQSLNDVLHTGPKIQNDLFTILLRFRMPRYVFTTATKNLSTPMTERFKWLFGTRPTPYMAIKCLLKSSHEYRQKYVDDGLLGIDSLTSAKQTQNELKIIIKSAGFELRKWCANHPHLLEGIPADHKQINLDIDDGYRDQIKTRGLTWHPKEGTCCLKIGQTLTKKHTNIKKKRKFSVGSNIWPSEYLGTRNYHRLNIYAEVVKHETFLGRGTTCRIAYQLDYARST